MSRLREILVEVRKGGVPVMSMSFDVYLNLLQNSPEDPAEGGTAHFVKDCDHCHIRHELGTMEEWLAALGLVGTDAAAEFSRSCVVGAARGGI